jgi:TPR repeat protein
MSYMGQGVAQNFAEAARWYRKTAAQNQIDALYVLGTMYLYGYGVRRNPEHEYVLCDIALSQGEARGLPCRDSAERSMSSDQVESARRNVAEWNILADKAWSIN